MKTEKIELNKLNTNINNVKFHNQRNIDSIKQSLKKFGQYSPLVVSKNNFQILKGAGTYKAMIELGWKQCEVCFLQLDEIQQNQLIVLDNRTSQLSELDNEMIEKILYDLDEQSIRYTGINNKQLQSIMNSEDITQQDQTEKINLTQVKCPYCGKLFSIQ